MVAAPDTLLARTLDDLLQRGLGRVETITRGELPPDGLGLATVTPAERLVVTVLGEARFLTVENGRTTEHLLGPGDALVLAAACWLVSAPRRPYRLLGVVTGGTQPRCHLVRHPLPGLQPRVGVIAARPLPAATTAVLAEELRCVLATSGPAAGARRRSHLGLALCSLRETFALDPVADDGVFTAACALIEERCESPLSRSSVARILGVHPNHLSRVFARHGLGFADHLRNARLARAGLMLADTRLRVAEVARRCGFGSTGLLIRWWRQVYGTTPRARR